MDVGKLRRILFIIFMLSAVPIAFVACMSGNVKSAPGTTTTIILIRHAEKTGQGLVNGSYLTPEGRARSQALVKTLKDTGVTAIYSPNTGRNIETVQPLSEAIGIPVTINNSIFATLAVDEITADILSKHAGGIVLYVGNVSGNLMAMHRYLGGSGQGPTVYGEMAIFTISDQGTQSITEAQFGD